MNRAFVSRPWAVTILGLEPTIGTGRLAPGTVSQRDGHERLLLAALVAPLGLARVNRV